MRLAKILFVFSWVLVFVSPGRAQTQDVQQLKDQLNKLEGEIAQLNKLQDEIAQLKAKISVLESGKAPPVPAPPAQEAAITTPSIVPNKTEEQVPMEQPEPVPENSLDLYGFAMLDSGYDFKTNDPDWFDVVRPTKLPAFAGEFAPNGKVFAGVRQSRFGVKTLNSTPFGNLKTIFEFELFGTGIDAGQTTFRIRQAYGELGHFGAGQTWSAFMDIDVFPNSLEYWGPSGMVFFRNVQARWIPIQGKSNVVIALERPGASADGGIYAGRVELAGIAPQFKWPDVTFHARLAGEKRYIQVGGIWRKIAWVDTTFPSAFNFSGKANGWGVNVSSNLDFTAKDVAKLQVVYGRGIENYMNDAPIDIGVKNNFTNPVSPVIGVALPVLGIVGFLDHTWSDKFTSSAGYSLVNITNSNAQLPSDFHQGHYALANLLYHPLKAVTMGAEFQFGRRLNFLDGFNFNDYRIQVSLKYDWSKGYEY